MSKPANKLPGTAGDVPPIRRLKQLAAKSADLRGELWAWKEDPALTNAAIRGRIEARWGLHIKRDDQLSLFWEWLRQVRRQDARNIRIAQFEEWYKHNTPDASVEQIRDAGIAFFLTETVADEDRKGFTEVARLDLDKRGMKARAKFEERKVSVSERRVAVLENNIKEARSEIAKLRDPKQELGEEERKAIVDKVDEILGLK